MDAVSHRDKPMDEGGCARRDVATETFRPDSSNAATRLQCLHRASGSKPVRPSASTCCQVKFSICQQTLFGRSRQTFTFTQIVAPVTEGSKHRCHVELLIPYDCDTASSGGSPSAHEPRQNGGNTMTSPSCVHFIRCVKTCRQTFTWLVIAVCNYSFSPMTRINVANYNWNNPVEGDEIGGACSTNGEEERV
jgi:hypothetical protein